MVLFLSEVAGMSVLKSTLRLGREVLIVVLITVALAEVSLRIYNYFNPLPIFYTDSYNRFRGKPFSSDYSFRLNSRGFKDVEFSPKKAAGTFRILGIGDSFAFGVVPYEYNYLTLIGQQLKQSGHNIELINMGIPGIGPKEYLSLLAREGFAIEPDRVLLSFFIGNDFVDLFGDENRTLVSYSYAMSLISYAYSLWTKVEGRIIHTPGLTYHDDAVSFTDKQYFDIQVRGRDKYLRDNQATDFATALTYISEIKQLCERRNIGLTIVIIPEEMQVSRPLQERVMADSGFAPTLFDFERPNKLLRARLEELRIDFIDLQPEFSNHSINERLYRRSDIHWNIAGNALAAELISHHLSSQLGGSLEGYSKSTH